MGVVVRRYIDILTIIINFPYSPCISSFFGSSIPTSLFILKRFFRSCIILTKRDFSGKTSTLVKWCSWYGIYRVKVGLVV